MSIKFSTADLVNYWITTAEHDITTMKGLYKIKRYSDCLFFGHIVLEKILKAYVVEETKKQAPYTHDLMVLYKLLKGLKLDEVELKLLDDVNSFNIRARYPDVKLKFYKLCTQKYTKNYLEKISNFYQKLWQGIRPKS